MYYPSVLDENPQIYFRLRCRKFVEMMRQAVPPPKTKSLNGAGPTMTPTTEDAFEQEDMDVDEPNGANGNPPMDDWDRMETEEAVDGAGKGGATKGGAGIQDPMLAMVETLRYGEELKREYKDDGRKEVKQALAEIFALFAYEDPRFSPTAQVMDPSGRAPVAEELNSAILGERTLFSSYSVVDARHVISFERNSPLPSPFPVFPPISNHPSRVSSHSSRTSSRMLISPSLPRQILLRRHRARVPASRSPRVGNQ